MNYQESEIVSLHKKHHQLEARMDKLENRFNSFMDTMQVWREHSDKEMKQNREDIKTMSDNLRWFAIFLTGFATLLIGVLKFV